MKYMIILLVLVGFFVTIPTFAVSYSPLDVAEFVGLNDTYALGDEFTIQFEKMTQQPCPSYEISLIKDGFPESKITYGREPLCATAEPVESYLFSDEFSKPEFFDTVGTYHVELKIDGTTLLKKIEILDNTQTDTAESTSSENLDDKFQNAMQRCSKPLEGFAYGTAIQNSTHYFDDTVACFIFDNRMIKGSNDVSAEERVYENFPDFLKPPIKQIKSGISSDEIQCNDSLVFVTKNNGAPACVKPLTVEKLNQRGWVIDEDSESLNKKWGELYLEYQLLKESFSDNPNNMTTIERMAEIDDETMRIATILSERGFTIDVPETEPEFEPISEPYDDPLVYSLPFGMTQEELENQALVDPIYTENPNNPGELILDIDAMMQVQKILNKCDYKQKLESGEIPTKNPDGSINVITGSLPFYNNGTHYIDSNVCKWIDSLEALTHHCFDANSMGQNWYDGPVYFDNGTHHLDRQYCKWDMKNED